MKIAFVYDRVNKFGGAERVLLALHEIWPEAPLYTAVYNRKTASWADCFDVRPSFLRFFPFISGHHELFPLATSLAMGAMKLNRFDVVLSVTSADAKSITAPPNTLHICYLLTPARYLWSGYRDYLENPGFNAINPVIRIFMKMLSPMMRMADFAASKKPDFYITISRAVEKRIKTYYKREAKLIYPPVDTNKFRPKTARSRKDGNYFLIVSRLVPYKKIDYVISAFNTLGHSLKIIGTGIEEDRLKKMAGGNIEFIGSGLTDEKLCWYYQNCTALIFPGEEDFGIAAVEAQACGAPVIGINKGGLSEIVLPGVTGELYENNTQEALERAIKKFEKKHYKPSLCRNNATRFTREKFQQMMRDAVEGYWRSFEKSKMSL